MEIRDIRSIFLEKLFHCNTYSGTVCHTFTCTLQVVQLQAPLSLNMNKRRIAPNGARTENFELDMSIGIVYSPISTLVEAIYHVQYIC